MGRRVVGAQWPGKQGGDAKTAREITERNSLCSHRKQKHLVFIQISATALKRAKSQYA